MARKKAFDQNKVLEKAVTLFWKEGYSGTSPEEIVNKLGISRSSLYNTFGNKRELFLKSLKRYIDIQSENMIAKIDASDDIKECMKDIFESMVDFNKKNNQYGCFAINTTVELSRQDAAIKHILDSNHHSILQALNHLIRRSQQNGKMSNSADSKKLAQFVYNNIVGIRVNVRAKTSQTELKNIINLVLNVLN